MTSETVVKPNLHNEYSSIWKLTSPNDESNWDTWAFEMGMMLRGKHLDYVVEGTHKEGYDGNKKNLLSDADARKENRTVCSVIASRVHEENFQVIQPFLNNAR